MARRKNRRRRGGRSGGGNHVWEEWNNGVLFSGNTGFITRNGIEVAQDRAIKLLTFHFEGVSAQPATVDLSAQSPLQTHSGIKFTGPFLVGTTPVRKTLIVNSPWFAQGTPGETVLFSISILCPDKNL